MIEAAYYQTLPHERTKCFLCPHGCITADGQAGVCGVRANHGGKLYAESYGVITACALDPIEKKPLYHFHPGSRILSIGSVGCNFRCAFCQNYSISTLTRDAFAPPGRPNENRRTASSGYSGLESASRRHRTPEEITKWAAQLISEGNIGLAYTYNEPLIGYEFIQHCALSAREKNLKNVLVTNGYICQPPLLALLPLIDALNIDLKGFTESFYQRVQGGLQSVKDTIQLAAQHTHVEVTTLVIPGENDSEAEIDALAVFLADIRTDIPLHLTRFFPRHHMLDRPPTPTETIHRLKKVAEQHLRYVYAGNMH